MSIFCITGISGYIGQLLLKRLETYGDCQCIIGIDIKQPPYESSKLKFYNLDIRDKALGEIFEKEKVDTIIHLAFIFQPIRNIKIMYDINVNGAINVMKMSQKNNVKRFFLFSSTTAYGAYKDNPEFLTEESSLRGNTDFYYTKDKAEVEKIAAQFRKENPSIMFTNIRPCIIFGRNVNNHISRYANRPFVPFIAGHNPDFQLIHEDDLMNAVIISLDKNISGDFNIVGEQTIPIHQIPSVLNNRLLKIPYPLFWLMHELSWLLHLPFIETPASMSSLIRYRWVCSGEKAKAELGFMAKYSAKDALLDFIKGVKK